MTVLEAEEDTEQSAPPRKKFCLSLSGRNRSIVKNTEPPRAALGGGVLDQKSTSFGTSKMLNGCRNQSSSHPTTNYDIMGPGSDCLRIATLCNLGNTCFLNSVLYTLRFTPSFLHNLHHLAIDLSSLNDTHLQTKMKSSSLGRTGVSLSASGNRSMSSKDLLALAGPTHEYNKPRIQVATEKLHELFIALRDSEIKENNEPFQPGAFLQALREVNTIFEGNQQQDAHELLVCLLDNIRETFQLLVRHRESQFGQTNGAMPHFSVERVIDSHSDGITSSKRRTKSWKKVLQKGSTIGVMQNLNGIQSSSKPSENGYSDFSESNGDVNSQHRHESKKCFISEDFEGVSLLRTTCLECEQVTERKEIFCDICVPIDIDRSNDDDDDKKKDRKDSSEVYRRAVVTSELLCGRDKYWCEHCLRLNEARRAVCFPSLPRLLILQLKRFSTAAGSMEKINNYMPTPLDLECFCEECYSEQRSGSGRSESRHLYQLYSVIMHQGATMTAGHYVAYSKLPNESAEYFRCDRDIKRPNEAHHSTSNSKSQSLISKYFSRSKPNINENKESSVKTGCRSAECCGIRQGKPLEAGMWLECDDETVRVIQVQELQDKLAHNPRNSATPYLLFYVKTTTEKTLIMTKHQQVSVDLVNMVFTACTYLALAGIAWIFLRLLQACFWLPKHLKKQNNVQQMLQDKVDSYEKYVLECEEKEKLMTPEEKQVKDEANPDEKVDNRTFEEKCKERRECLEMLKRELRRVQEGGDPYDWDHLLDDTDDEEKKESTEVKKEEETSSENPKVDEENVIVEEKKDK